MERVAFLSLVLGIFFETFALPVLIYSSFFHHPQL